MARTLCRILASLSVVFAVALAFCYMEFGKCEDCWCPAGHDFPVQNYKGEYLKTYRFCDEHVKGFDLSAHNIIKE